jgi:hypothetical protein
MASEPPEIIFDRKPSPLENGLRIGCGTLLGVLLGISIGLQFWRGGWGSILGVVAVSVVVCGWAAMRFGDRFWMEGLRRWLPWWL